MNQNKFKIFFSGCSGLYFKKSRLYNIQLCNKAIMLTGNVGATGTMKTQKIVQMSISDFMFLIKVAKNLFNSTKGSK